MLRSLTLATSFSSSSSSLISKPFFSISPKLPFSFSRLSFPFPQAKRSIFVYKSRMNILKNLGFGANNKPTPSMENSAIAQGPDDDVPAPGQQFAQFGAGWFWGVELALQRVPGVTKTEVGDATTYVVGDTSGWDISTDIDSWVSDKRFNVGTLISFLLLSLVTNFICFLFLVVFQHSSYHSVSEVTKKSFKTCNTTDTLRTFSNGNTTVTLSNVGARYFVYGNRLHCLGGMKLQVNVEGDQTSSTVGAPEAQPGTTLPQPASKNNNPSIVIPTSSGYIIGGIQCLIIALLCLTATMLFLFQT
ncbi:uncharacterized protein LOC111290341 [Durio zibethinus]|uniref:Uncharacterized protein LOC111290341 n=1 Tax=Durio zibethinus TaxID=66656 RepID=A0A6P5YAI9_DURZI|nr:uncharacterized protein LOC111290341 [Durio zibethinus]